MNSNDLTIREMCRLGRDVLENRDMQALRTFPQHGTVSRYEHCLAVCYIALRLADKWRVRVDRRSMVRGALLHDFFMYNWNDPASMRPLHGFTHAREALSNVVVRAARPALFFVFLRHKPILPVKIRIHNTL